MALTPFAPPPILRLDRKQAQSVVDAAFAKIEGVLPCHEGVFPDFTPGRPLWPEWEQPQEQAIMRLLMLPDDARARECAITVARALLAYQAHLDHAAGLRRAADEAAARADFPGVSRETGAEFDDFAADLRKLAGAE